MLDCNLYATYKRRSWPARCSRTSQYATSSPLKGRQVDVYDSRIRGLAVRVSPMGTKAFVVWYRIGSKARRLTLGRFPTMSLAEARKRAQEALLQVADGKDPAAESSARDGLWRQAVRAASRRVHRDLRQAQDAPLARDRAAAQARVRQPLGKLADPDHLQTRRDQSAECIVDRGTPSAANRALAIIRRMFSWTLEQGHLDRSPCFGVKAPQSSRAATVCSPMPSLVRVGQPQK